MAKGPPYSRLQQTHRNDRDFIEKRLLGRVDEGIESAKINTEGQECKFCSFKASYKFFRCPSCGKEQPKEETMK